MGLSPISETLNQPRLAAVTRRRPPKRSCRDPKPYQAKDLCILTAHRPSQRGNLTSFTGHQDQLNVKERVSAPTNIPLLNFFKRHHLRAGRLEEH